MDTAVGKTKRTQWRNWLAALGKRRARYRLSHVERAMISANGKALTLIVTALQARGHLDVSEFADLLGLFSAVSAEDDELEGTILTIWSGLMTESVTTVDV